MTVRVQGYVRRGCLYQLLEEGQLGIKQLAENIGTSTNVMFGAVHYFLKLGILIADPVKVRVHGARRTVMYGLSKAGIKLALSLDLQPKDAGADGIPAELM